jgi:hypothetical protein
MANGMANGSDGRPMRKSTRSGWGRRAGDEGQAPPVASPARSILRGELENVGLATLLTILDMERRSGLVVVERPGLLGKLHVREGRVIRAALDGIGSGAANANAERAGAEAVFEMLGWTEGRFELWQTRVEGKDEVGESTTFLLIQGAHRADLAAGVLRPRSVQDEVERDQDHVDHDDDPDDDGHYAACALSPDPL